MCFFTVMKSIVKDWCSQGKSTWNQVWGESRNQSCNLYCLLSICVLTKVCCIRHVYILCAMLFSIYLWGLPSNSNSKVTIWDDLLPESFKSSQIHQNLVPDFFDQHIGCTVSIANVGSFDSQAVAFLRCQDSIHLVSWEIIDQTTRWETVNLWSCCVTKWLLLFIWDYKDIVIIWYD